MSRTFKRFLIVFLCLIGLASPLRAGALSLFGYDRVYHKPALTVILLNGSPDAEMKVKMVRRNGAEFNTLPQKEHRLWETYFRIYRAGVEGMTAWFGNAKDFKDAEILLEDKGQTYTFPVPYEKLKEASYDDYLIIDLKDGSIGAGIPFTRTLAFFLLHLAIYMGIEILFFCLFQFRSRHDWTIFLVYTLITKGLLCFAIRNCLNTDDRIYLLFAFLTVFLAAFDIGVFLLTMEDEHNKISKFSATANLVSGLAVYFAMTKLPL